MIQYCNLNKNQNLSYDLLIEKFGQITINQAIKKELIKINSKDKSVLLNLEEKNSQEILDETCLVHEKKAKDILGFLIDKSNYIESYLNLRSIINIFGRNSKSAIDYLYYCNMINFVGQTEKLELDNSVIQDVTSTLIEDQEKIYKNLQDSIDSNNGRSFLLYGPNDSGKKEICLHLLKSLLKNSNSALVLCPTIEKSQLFFTLLKVYLFQKKKYLFVERFILKILS